MSRFFSILGFVLIGLAGVVVDLRARMSASRLAPLGELLDEVMASRAARITIVLFWWWLAWHFLAVSPEDG